MRQYRIAAIPADGIGKEVIAAGLNVLAALEARDGGFRLEVEHFPWGSDYYRKHGLMMAEDGLERLKGFDAIFFGAVGEPEDSRSRHAVGLAPADLPGLRPIRQCAPGARAAGHHDPAAQCAPGDLDWIVVRENSEGEYAGNGGRVHRGLPEEVATETSVFTRDRRRSASCASPSTLARKRPRKQLTVVTKSNAQRHGMVMWDEIVAEVAQGLSRRELGPRAGRRHDDAHGAEAQDASTSSSPPTCMPTS